MTDYEQECEWYALHGNPQQDAMDYEMVARFDRYDGWGDPQAANESLYDWEEPTENIGQSQIFSDAPEDLGTGHADAKDGVSENCEPLPF